MKIEDKNIELLKLITQLRDHIDVYRIIGLNARTIRNSKIGISDPLLGHLQKSAQELLAIYICKIFESSSRNDLNSIPGIIKSLPSTPLSNQQRQEITAFGKKYGNTSNPTEAKPYLHNTFELFCRVRSNSLDRLKEFRDKIGAHSDSEANIQSLPSLAEFEILYDFASDFHELVRSSIDNLYPVIRPNSVGHGFVWLLQSLGLQEAKFDFNE